MPTATVGVDMAVSVAPVRPSAKLIFYSPIYVYIFLSYAVGIALFPFFSN
jgi:hypothetical protein